MNYEEMSDDEVNYEVAKHSFDAAWLERHYGKDGMIPDYCNNVEDAWPVIFESGISLCKPNSYRDEWSCFLRDSIGFVSNIVYHERPLRSAMIVFLMMKDADND